MQIVTKIIWILLIIIIFFFVVYVASKIVALSPSRTVNVFLSTALSPLLSGIFTSKTIDPLF